MSIELVRVERRANAAAPRTDRIERALGRFRDDVQPRVRQIAARHTWIADLAVSFPALLFGLAYPRTHVLRDAGARAVLGGAPLSTAASAAGVPLWLRGFAPMAFTGPLPALPDGAAFRRRISNHFPKAWRFASRWLDSVSIAASVADDDVAVWMAREAPARARRRNRRFLRDYRRLVSLWAWCTKNHAAAGALAETKWNAEMKWAVAQAAALNWSDAATTHLALGGDTVQDNWLWPAVIDGYAFTPLVSTADLAEESRVMNHCARTYGRDIAENRYRLWSVRRDGERVATLCLGAAYTEAPFPHVAELSGPRNAPVDQGVWLAARRWLHAQDVLPANPERIRGRYGETRPDAWRALWRDYWLAKRRIPGWLPLRPGDMYDV